MDIITFLSLIASISGISFMTICSTVFALSKCITRKKFGFTKETVYKCTRGYIEPIYEIEGKVQKDKIMKTLKKNIFKYPSYKFTYIVGDSGVGKTYLTNCFIWKYDGYSRLKEKRIFRIFGLECENLLEIIKTIENKENTILIIDGLEEAFIYKQNDILKLNNLNEELFPFYKVLITINSKFYKQNRKILNDMHYRNADQKKFFPIILHIKPFSTNLIVKYVNKYIKLAYRKRKNILNGVMKHTKIFSNPLLLSYITLYSFKQENFTSTSAVLKHIFISSLDWEENKYSTIKESEKKRQETLRIMNQISWLYINGKRPILKSNMIVYNDLLTYDKRKHEYRFSHNLFLEYNTVEKFYSKISISCLKLNAELQKMYLEKIMQRHLHLIINNKNITLKVDVVPTLEIRHACIFKERWLLGLLKGLLDCDVILCDFAYKSYYIYQVAKQYILQGHLGLQGMNIDEKQLEWWSDLSIKSIDISNTQIRNIVLPDNWIEIQSFCGEKLQLEKCAFINNMAKLKQLSLSGVQISKIKDLQNLTSLPEGISIDLSNCGITDENMPTFLFSTIFEDVFLDYNRIQKTDFIRKMKYKYLNLSNNPIKVDDNRCLSNKNIQCDFYFESEEITDYLCKNKSYLTYEEAVNIKSAELHRLNLKNVNGLENLPNLKSMVINIYQLPMINDIFAFSKLETIKVVTYGLYNIVDLKFFYPALKYMVMEVKNYEAICWAAKVIMGFTSELLASYKIEYLFEKSGQLPTKCSLTMGVESLVDYMNIDLSLFLRRVVDAFNYATRFWDGDTEDKKKENKYLIEGEILEIGSPANLNYDNISKQDYDYKLFETCNMLKIKHESAEKSEYLLLQFFSPIYNILEECVHTPIEEQILLNKRVGREINIKYLGDANFVWPKGRSYIEKFMI